MGKSVQIKTMSFSYRDETVLKNVNLTIGRKTFLAIIGPNGSGKTTLLKTIAKNLKPSMGAIHLEEKDLSSISSMELAREMAVVHQENDNNAPFTVHDIVMMGRNPYINRFKKESEHDQEIVDQALKWTNTFHLKDRFVTEISGGERQRVMIAKSIAQEPKVLLLDEPTSFLDVHHQIEILELLKKLNREQHISIIAAIHDLNLAARYSDEVLLLHRGQVVTLGPTEKVMTVDNLEKAYAMKMIVDRNAYTGCLQVNPLSVEKPQGMKKSVPFIIAGGGIGQKSMMSLYQAGYSCITGVLNKGDSDCQLAERLGFIVIAEAPFHDVSQENLDIAMEYLQKSTAVVLTSIPIGRGNMANLLIAMKALEKNIPVLWLDTYDPAVSFDYVNGKGIQMLKRMHTMGMKRLQSLDDVMEAMKRMEECTTHDKN